MVKRSVYRREEWRNNRPEELQVQLRRRVVNDDIFKSPKQLFLSFILNFRITNYLKL